MSPNNSRVGKILSFSFDCSFCFLLNASQIDTVRHKRIIILVSMYSVPFRTAIEGNGKRLVDIYVNW